jgi:hypothetical protein
MELMERIPEQSLDLAKLEAQAKYQVAVVKLKIDTMAELMRSVLQKGRHYGLIPGCGDKPALFKAGAEAIAASFGLDTTIDNIARRDFDGGHVEFIVRISLVHRMTGVIAGTGIGLCSSLEKKYRFRRDGSENPNIADVHNTVLKMAKKRALVDATLTAAAASDLFSQDFDDYGLDGVEPEAPTYEQQEAAVRHQQEAAEKRELQRQQAAEKKAEQAATKAAWDGVQARMRKLPQTWQAAVREELKGLGTSYELANMRDSHQAELIVAAVERAEAESKKGLPGKPSTTAQPVAAVDPAQANEAVRIYKRLPESERHRLAQLYDQKYGAMPATSADLSAEQVAFLLHACEAAELALIEATATTDLPAVVKAAMAAYQGLSEATRTLVRVAFRKQYNNDPSVAMEPAQAAELVRLIEQKKGQAA